MILTFPFAFGGKETPEQIGQANLFVRLARMSGLDVRIVQMTDLKTVEIAGIDECVRTDDDELGQWHLKAMQEFPYPQFLRVDYDIVVRSEVADVFDYDFDIAVAKERRGLMNNGVVFVKNRQFFDEAILQYREHTAMDGWQDIQHAMQRAIDGGKFRVRKLDPELYNHFYKPGESLWPAKIVHFKGEGKSSMSDYRTLMDLKA